MKEALIKIKIGPTWGPYLAHLYLPNTNSKKAKKCVNHREIVGWDYLFDNL